MTFIIGKEWHVPNLVSTQAGSNDDTLELRSEKKFQRKQAQTMTNHHEYAANATRDTHNEISVLLYSAPVQQSVCTRKGGSGQTVDLASAFSSAKHPRGSGPHSSVLRATT